MMSFRHLGCETDSDVLELVFGVKLAQYFWVGPSTNISLRLTH